MIDSDSADAVAAIHVIEHFYEWEALPMLLEWKRILKPGGKMILELPCLDKVFAYIARQMNAGKPIEHFLSMWAMWGDPKHEDPGMCHKWGYFNSTLRELLTAAGMREITFMKPRYHFPFRDMRVECVK